MVCDDFVSLEDGLSEDVGATDFEVLDLNRFSVTLWKTLEDVVWNRHIGVVLNLDDGQVDAVRSSEERIVFEDEVVWHPSVLRQVLLAVSRVLRQGDLQGVCDVE